MKLRGEETRHFEAGQIVRFPEGTARGFLTLSGERGDVLAYGDLVQTLRKDSTMESRLTFHFKDGSIYDETVTFSQRGVFALQRYRIVQRGPSFPETIEATIDRETERYHERLLEATPQLTANIGQVHVSAPCRIGRPATSLDEPGYQRLQPRGLRPL